MGTGPYLPLLGLLAIHFILQGCDASDCPSGWVKYLNICYGLFSENKDWIQAEIQCQNHGQSSHLVSILTEQEGELLSNHILTNSPKLETLWIGLRDQFKNGRWRWSDTSTSMYKAWVDGVPKKIDESGFCAYLSIEQDYLKWNDSFCNLKKPFICSFTM